MSGKGTASESETRPETLSETLPKTMSGKELIDALFAAFLAKDLALVMNCFADDAIFYDPHYPQPRMVGRAAIEQGFAWGLNGLEKPGFELRHIWIEENSAVVEMDTHHRLKGGMEAKFDQVFVFEFRNSKLTRVQSYVPYRPPGIGGLIPRLTGLIWRLQGKGV